jgi:hypothetical protein
VCVCLCVCVCVCVCVVCVCVCRDVCVRVCAGTNNFTAHAAAMLGDVDDGSTPQIKLGDVSIHWMSK